MDNKLEIISAINLTDYQSNSLIVAKIDKSILNDEQALDSARRTVDDLRKRFNLDESTAFFITPEDMEVEALDEKKMADKGWVKSKKINELRKVITLLNSMVLGGENHSESSEKMVREAMG